MKKLLYFLHGWAYDRHYWNDFVVQRDSYRMILGDLGFFDGKGASYPEEYFIGIGHSIGFLRMLIDWPEHMKGLIGINAFPRFVQFQDFPNGVPLYVLERMKDKLTTNPSELLHNFWTKNGISGPKGKPNINRLRDALDFLIGSDGGEKLKGIGAGKLLLLSGRRDNILQVKEGDFAHHAIHWREDAGHHLIRSHSDWCWHLIANFIESHAG